MGQISPGLVSHAAASGRAECATTSWTQSLVRTPNSLLCVINARHRAVRALLPSGLEPPRCALLMTTLRSCYLPAMGPVPGNQSPRPGEPPVSSSCEGDGAKPWRPRGGNLPPDPTSAPVLAEGQRLGNTGHLAFLGISSPRLSQVPHETTCTTICLCLMKVSVHFLSF